MKRVLVAMGIVAAVLVVWAAGFFALNSNSVADPRDVRERFGRAEALVADDALSITVWNLGYGGLGAESDFISDGGEHMFPPSRAAVRANVDFIAETLAGEQSDVIVFQEIAHDGPVNYWVNLKGAIDRTLADRDSAFFADFQTRLLPWPLRLEHGQAIYSNYAIAETTLVPLPAEDSAIFGVKRRYASLVARLPRADGGAGWTIASVHLAAFDEDAAVRTRQLHELLAWAQSEYERGQRVVLAGDWNFQIAATDFPHTTAQEHLFWLFPFPQDA
ncbi:MAG TPA: endonuclease/exonuclease/phosphatase family protein, partial [Terricaulis sp.]|nr:endonuclease/exonuclease/phosphatase family protein [Terricaulis sp.]